MNDNSFQSTKSGGAYDALRFKLVYMFHLPKNENVSPDIDNAGGGVSLTRLSWIRNDHARDHLTLSVEESIDEKAGISRASFSRHLSYFPFDRWEWWLWELTRNAHEK